MPDKHDKKALQQAWKQQQRQKLLDSLPITLEQFRELFDYLDSEAVAECDHTLRHTTRFLSQHGIDTRPVVAWLEEHGGNCDCEVLDNVESELSDL